MSVAHFWHKWQLKHECGTLANIVDIYFAETGAARFNGYCMFCATTFQLTISMEDIIVWANDADRVRILAESSELESFDLAKWEPEGEMQ